MEYYSNVDAFELMKQGKIMCNKNQVNDYGRITCCFYYRAGIILDSFNFNAMNVFKDFLNGWYIVGDKNKIAELQELSQ